MAISYIYVLSEHLVNPFFQMQHNKTLTVLESIFTISGNPRVILNSFDTDIPIGARLQNLKGDEWVVIGMDKSVFNKLDTKLKSKLTELGAVLYLIDPCNHNTRLEVGEQLIIL